MGLTLMLLTTIIIPRSSKQLPKVILFSLKKMRNCLTKKRLKSSYLPYSEHENAAVLLIENGIDPNVGSHMNDSALVYAISERNHLIH